MPSPIRGADRTNAAPVEPSSTVSPAVPEGLAGLTESSLQSLQPKKTPSCWDSLGRIYDHICMYVTIGYHWILKKLCCAQLPNFAKVSNDLYRGAQPTAEGFKELKNMGVKSVLNLRSLDTPEELAQARKEVEDAGLKFFHLPLSTSEPTKEQMTELFTILSREDSPLFVHCYFGADRTGFTVALHRIFLQDWEKEKAIQEMVDGGFGYHPFLSAGLREALESISPETLGLDSESF